MTHPTLTAELLAQAFHEAYERLAPTHGYETREASAKPWAEVPANNRALMTAVSAEMLQHLGLAERVAHPLRYATTTPDGQVVTGLGSDLTGFTANVFEGRRIELTHAADCHGYGCVFPEQPSSSVLLIDLIAEAARHGKRVHGTVGNLPPFDPTEVREHPGTGQPMTGVEHPADGTWSPELSSEQDGAAA